jgi:hypothetical protein
MTKWNASSKHDTLSKWVIKTCELVNDFHVVIGKQMLVCFNR